MASPHIVHSPDVMQRPMRWVCERLVERGIALGDRHALELFAREGNWPTTSYADKVARLEAWEIDPDCEGSLCRDLPDAAVRIGDPFALAALPEFADRFNVVLFDNPQVTFGGRNQHFERSEALDALPRLMAPKRWWSSRSMSRPQLRAVATAKERRNRIYRKEDTATLLPDFLLAFYAEFFYRAYFVAIVSTTAPAS